VTLQVVLLPVIASLLTGWFLFELFEYLRSSPRTHRRSYRRQRIMRLAWLGVAAVLIDAYLVSSLLPIT